LGAIPRLPTAGVAGNTAARTVNSLPRSRFQVVARRFWPDEGSSLHGQFSLSFLQTSMGTLPRMFINIKEPSMARPDAIAGRSRGGRPPISLRPATDLSSGCRRGGEARDFVACQRLPRVIPRCLRIQGCEHPMGVGTALPRPHTIGVGRLHVNTYSHSPFEVTELYPTMGAFPATMGPCPSI
jgi:hypothetical protein